MRTGIKSVAIGLCALSTTACMEIDNRVSGEEPYYSYSYNNSITYPQNYYQIDNYPAGNYRYSEIQEDVSVPDSYHVGADHSPVSFKDRDREWVSKQNPKAYTIELADGEKPSQVAQKLYKAPKNQRMGQVQYEKNGKSYYKGVYGSYDTPEAAQKALDSLPADIKQGAGVKSWSSVQGSI